jgi:hypothetical protein
MLFFPSHPVLDFVDIILTVDCDSAFDEQLRSSREFAGEEITCASNPLVDSDTAEWCRLGFRSRDEFDIARRGADIVFFSASALHGSARVDLVMSRFVHEMTIIVVEDPLAIDAQGAMTAAGVRRGVLLFLRRCSGCALLSYGLESSGRVRRGAALVGSILEGSGGYSSVTWGAAVHYSGVGRLPDVGRMVLVLAPDAALPNLEENLDLVAVDLSESRASRIPPRAFFRCSNLAMCFFPRELVLILDYSFSGCDHLVSVDLRDCAGFECLGDYCFDGCGSLSRLDLPPTVNYVGQWTLGGTSITFIDISGVDVEFGLIPFYACARLSRARFGSLSRANAVLAFEAILPAGGVRQIDTNLSAFGDILSRIESHMWGCDEVLIRGAGWATSVIREPVALSAVTWTARFQPELDGPTSLAITGMPSRWRERLKSDVSGHLHAVDVSSLPATAIEGLMFSFCRFLQRLSLPAALAEIPSGLCLDSHRVKEVNFVDLVNLVSVCDYAFNQCLPLEEFVIPPLLAVIEDGAFGATRIRSLDLGENPIVEANLDYLIFLEEATLPRAAGLVSFGSCNSLKSLTVGRAKWNLPPPTLKELRFMSLDGRVPAFLVPSLSRARVFGEVAALAGSVTCPALLP